MFYIWLWYWSGYPFPSPGDLPDPGIKPGSPAWAGRFFTIWATKEAQLYILYLVIPLPEAFGVPDVSLVVCYVFGICVCVLFELNEWAVIPLGVCSLIFATGWPSRSMQWCVSEPQSQKKWEPKKASPAFFCQLIRLPMTAQLKSI